MRAPFLRVGMMLLVNNNIGQVTAEGWLWCTPGARGMHSLCAGPRILQWRWRLLLAQGLL